MNFNHQETMVRSFLLSNIPSKTARDKLAKQIADLGGVLIDSPAFDEAATHVIFGQLSRNEKFLGACVTGKWILCTKYIEDSHQVEMWLDEENYEFCISDKRQPMGLVSAAKRWKWKMEVDGTRAFVDWQVSLLMNPRKRDGFQRVLKSGGATIFPFKAKEISHRVAFVLMDAQEYKNAQALCEEYDILCVREEYLGDFVIKHPEPDLFDYRFNQNTGGNTLSTLENSGRDSHLPVSMTRSPAVPLKNVSLVDVRNVSTNQSLNEDNKDDLKDDIFSIIDDINIPGVDCDTSYNAEDEDYDKLLHEVMSLCEDDSHEDLQPVISETVPKQEVNFGQICKSKSEGDVTPKKIVLIVNEDDEELIVTSRRSFKCDTIRNHKNKNSLANDTCKIVSSIGLNTGELSSTLCHDQKQSGQPSRSPERSIGNRISADSLIQNDQEKLINRRLHGDNSTSVVLHKQYLSDSISAVFHNNQASGDSTSAVLHNNQASGDSTSAVLQNDQFSLNASFHIKHFAAGTSLTSLAVCKSGKQKAFPSNLIPQWMQVHREMNLHTLALAHGRPDDSLKPSADILTQFLYLIQSEEIRIRNMAYHYLMSWFECNAPTNPAMIKIYQDFLHFSPDGNCLSQILDTLITTPNSEGHHLLFDFLVAVLDKNFQYHASSENKLDLKECLLIKCIWNDSNQIYYKKNMQIFKAFHSVLSLKSNNRQLIANVTTLLGLISECLRARSNSWSANNICGLSDCMISFSKDIVNEIRHGFSKGDEECISLTLQSLKPAWLRTIVTALYLIDFNDFLIMESIQFSEISLASIVTQYFYLLPPLTSKQAMTNSPCSSTVSKISDPPHKSMTSNISGENSTHRRRKNNGNKKINKRNCRGETPLHVAAIKNDIGAMKELLSTPGVNVNVTDYNKWTPLHEACNHGSFECVELLLYHVPVDFVHNEVTKRVNINAKGFAGMTPLHDAVNNGHLKISELLLKYGGWKLLTATTVDGYTPLDYAESEEMTKLLTSYLPGSNTQRAQAEPCHSQGKTLLPHQSLYNEVLGGKNCYVTKSDCSWFLSLLSLLFSSYIQCTAMKKGNSHKEKDCEVLKNLDFYLKPFQEHLRRITLPATFEELHLQIAIFEILAAQYV